MYISKLCKTKPLILTVLCPYSNRQSNCYTKLTNSNGKFVIQWFL